MLQDYKNCKIFELKAMKKKHEAFESDLAAHQVELIDLLVYIYVYLYTCLSIYVYSFFYPI